MKPVLQATVSPSLNLKYSGSCQSVEEIDFIILISKYIKLLSAEVKPIYIKSKHVTSQTIFTKSVQNH
jgi:hypothetical protein